MSNFKSRKIGNKKQRKIKPHSGSSSRTQPMYTSRRRGSMGKWVMTALVIIAGWYAIFFMLPRVEVIVIPETRELAFEDAMVLSSKADAAQSEDPKLLPVSRVTLPGQVSQTFSATGSKDIGERASGNVTFFNHTGIPQEVFIEDGLETIDGIQFAVRGMVIVPGATVSADGDVVPGTVNADIVALEAGPKGNINPQKIFIKSVDSDKQHKIYAQNTNALAGGTSNVVSVASEEDIAKAQDILREQVKQQIMTDISAELDSNEGMIGDLFTFVDEDFSTEIKPDDVVTSFVYTLAARGEVLVYEETELNNRIKKSLESKLTPSESFVSQRPEDVSFVNVVQESNGDIQVFVKAMMHVTQSLDTDQFVARILGKREADARRILLSSPSVTDVHFNWSLAPFSKRIPKSSSHIKIMLGTRD